ELLPSISVRVVEHGRLSPIYCRTLQSRPSSRLHLGGRADVMHFPSGVKRKIFTQCRKAYEKDVERMSKGVEAGLSTTHLGSDPGRNRAELYPFALSKMR